MHQHLRLGYGSVVDVIRDSLVEKGSSFPFLLSLTPDSVGTGWASSVLSVFLSGSGVETVKEVSSKTKFDCEIVRTDPPTTVPETYRNQRFIKQTKGLDDDDPLENRRGGGVSSKHYNTFRTYLPGVSKGDPNYEDGLYKREHKIPTETKEVSEGTHQQDDNKADDDIPGSGERKIPLS